MLNRFVMLGAALPLLAGCASMSPAEMRLADENRCLDYGYQKGTDAFARCRQEIDLRRQAEYADAIEDMTTIEPYYVPMPTAQRRQDVTCNTLQTGNLATTSCY